MNAQEPKLPWLLTNAEEVDTHMNPNKLGSSCLDSIQNDAHQM